MYLGLRNKLDTLNETYIQLLLFRRQGISDSVKPAASLGRRSIYTLINRCNVFLLGNVVFTCTYRNLIATSFV